MAEIPRTRWYLPIPTNIAPKKVLKNLLVFCWLKGVECWFPQSFSVSQRRYSYWMKLPTCSTEFLKTWGKPLLVENCLCYSWREPSHKSHVHKLMSLYNVFEIHIDIISSHNLPYPRLVRHIRPSPSPPKIQHIPDLYRSWSRCFVPEDGTIFLEGITEKGWGNGKGGQSLKTNAIKRWTHFRFASHVSKVSHF